MLSNYMHTIISGFHSHLCFYSNFTLEGPGNRWVSDVQAHWNISEKKIPFLSRMCCLILLLYVTNIWMFEDIFLVLKCLTCVIFVCKPLSFIVNYSCTYLNFNYQPHIVKNHTTPKNISTITLKLRMHYSLTWLLPCWGWVATFSCETTKKFCMLLPSSEPHTCFHYSC